MAIRLLVRPKSVIICPIERPDPMRLYTIGLFSPPAARRLPLSAPTLVKLPKTVGSYAALYWGAT